MGVLHRWELSLQWQKAGWVGRGGSRCTTGRMVCIENCRPSPTPNYCSSTEAGASLGSLLHAS